MSFVVFGQRWRFTRTTCCAVAATVLTLEVSAALAGDTTAPTKNIVPPAAILSEDAQPQYWFGVAVENIPPAFSKQFKLKPDQGVMVVAVFKGSPAEKAGLQAEDLLIELNSKPLTSQDDLARAANTIGTAAAGAGKNSAPLMQVSQITYQRNGDRFTATLTPELRPLDMQVTGANSEHFTPTAVMDLPLRDVRNVVLSNGVNVQYGPGFHVDANARGNLTVLRQAVGSGQVVVVTQEPDDAGNTRVTIRDGGKTYNVEAGKLDALPAHLRPLAEQLIAQSTTAPAGAHNAAPASASTDDRLQRLEQQNEELKRQLEDVKALLLKNSQNAGGPK